MVKKTLALGAMAALCVATTLDGASAIKVLLLNKCAQEFPLSYIAETNIVVENFVPGSTMTKELLDGSPSHLFKAGTGPQATLAELTPKDGKVNYDISIVPTGSGPNSKGPGECKSFAECKALTNGHSFNLPMQIIPQGGASGAFPTCGTVTCMFDGCPDAYLFPSDNSKMRVCPGNMDMTIIFCPGGPGGQTPPPTTAAPTPSSSTSFNGTGTVELVIGIGRVAATGSGSGSPTAAVEDAIVDVEKQTTTSAPPPATTTLAPAPEPSAVAAPQQENVQEVTTKSSLESSTGPEVYVLLSVGGVAMVAGVAIFVSRKKKQQMEALDDKTPRSTRTTGAGHLFVLTTPNEATML